MKKLILSLVLSASFVAISATSFAYFSDDTSYSGVTQVDYSGYGSYNGWYFNNYCRGFGGNNYGDNVICDYTVPNNSQYQSYTTSYNNSNYYDGYYDYEYNQPTYTSNHNYVNIDYSHTDNITNSNFDYYNSAQYRDYFTQPSYTSANLETQVIRTPTYTTYITPVAYTYFNYSSNINYNDPNFLHPRNNVYTCANGIVSDNPFDCNRYR